MVVEGINAIPAALELADKYDVEMPIVFAVDAVVNGHAEPRKVIYQLMHREKKSEMVI
jgi:glycerol-3-phosphate dehydrogenase (NAD(P)+)